MATPLSISDMPVDLSTLVAVLGTFALIKLWSHQQNTHRTHLQGCLPVPEGLPTVVASGEVKSDTTTHLNFASSLLPSKGSYTTPTILKDFALTTYATEFIFWPI